MYQQTSPDKMQDFKTWEFHGDGDSCHDLLGYDTIQWSSAWRW
jgi:hypothetical protein